MCIVLWYLVSFYIYFCAFLYHFVFGLWISKKLLLKRGAFFSISLHHRSVISACYCCRGFLRNTSQRWLLLNYCVHFTRALFLCTVLRNGRWLELRRAHMHATTPPTHTHPYRVTHEHTAVDAANLVIRTQSGFGHSETFL